MRLERVSCCVSTLAMRIPVLILLALLFTTPCGAHRASPPYHSLTREFAQFQDTTVVLPEARRVAQFRERFDVLFPGFYEPAPGQTLEQFDRSVARALADFASIRSRYEQVERVFPERYAQGIAHFRKHFPGFKPVLPVWLVHSLGRMDGGTRTLRGRNVMIFGADVIARIHDDQDIGPFLDHELFHVENGRWFSDCMPDTTIWCSLWQEGTATYAAAVMNPGADDHLLMLDRPAPIRAAIDADWRAALCRIREDLDRTDQPSYARYFMSAGPVQKYPARWGYYVGYRLAQRVGQRMTLARMSRLGHAAVEAIVTREIDAMTREAGGCGGWSAPANQ